MPGSTRKLIENGIPGAGASVGVVPVRLLLGTAPIPAGVTREQEEMLSARLPNFRSDSVAGSGQYIHEEQPEVVVEAVARLEEASR